MKIEPIIAPPPAELNDREYEFLRQVVYEHSRINLGPDKRALVSARVGKRLRALKLGGYGDYCRWLQSAAGGEELSNLVDVISTNHTNFFREEKHFEFLQNRFLPEWHRQHASPGETLRVWSAASSSGEEPYTLAIVLAEFFGISPGWNIEATDISTRILERASKAVYDAEKVRPIRPELLRRYFQRGTGDWDGHYRVKEVLRQQVNFRHLNLLQAHYPFREHFHLIFCRNVMIYFDRPTQELLVGKLTQHLEPGGFLIVGHSESLNGIRHSLRQLQPTIYFKP